MDTEPDAPILLKARGIADVLAYLPYRFGYVPTDSLAVLAISDLAPGRRQLGVAARLDLPDLADPEVLGAALAGITAHMENDGAQWAFTVLYTDVPFEEIASGISPAGMTLRRWLRGFPLSDRTSTVLVRPDSYRCLECAEHPCCPTDGHPISTLSSTTVAAEMVLAGEALVGSRAELGCPLDVDPAARADAVAAAEHERAALRGLSGRARARWRRDVLDDVARALLRTGRGRPVPVATLGRLSAALADGDVRDVVLAWVLSGHRYGLRSPQTLDVLTSAMDGTLTPPPEQHVQAVRRLLADVARHGAPGSAGRPLAILAWLAWWRGEGARADVLARQAHDDDPVCRLADLMRAILDHAVPPGWARPSANRFRAVSDRP